MTNKTLAEKSNSWDEVVSTLSLDLYERDKRIYLNDNKEISSFEEYQNYPEFKKFQKWIYTKENTGNTFFNVSMYLWCFRRQEEINKQDKDCCVVVTGKEGSGKSTLAIQMASIIDPSFQLNQIFFSREDLLIWCKNNINNTKGKAVILDEGNLFLFSREAMKSGSLTMIKFLAQCRQLNLFLILCIPDYKTIDLNIRRHRIDYLFNVVRAKSWAVCSDKEAINKINFLIAKGINMNKVEHHTMWGTHWISKLPKINDISDESYKSIKKDNFSTFLDEAIEELQTKKAPKESPWKKVGEASKIIGINPDTVRRWADTEKIPCKKIGEQRLIDVSSFLKE
jgi:energy-coupling factor transporter ATP-binding protein EcfA2